MQTFNALHDARQALGRSLGVFLRDVGRGALEVSHNSLALVGLAVVAGVVFMSGRADLRERAEVSALGWLQTRFEARAVAEGNLLAVVGEPDAIARATATDPTELSRDQKAVATWLARRYRVAPEPLSRLVQEAWSVGEQARIDPTLILAIMAMESSFNPFAQSSVGAQGLMQVMTHIHDDKYEAFGGVHAAFDPVTNLRVGVMVLKECIRRAGSVEAGLRYYVGAAIHGNDGGYVAKVLYEQSHLQQVARGIRVATNVSSTPPAPAPEPEVAPTPEVSPAEDQVTAALS
jgi:hypothetical protein